MIKRLSEKYQQWNYLRKSKKTQSYSFRGVALDILPGVFSPKGTRTTELFANYLLQFDWKEKRVLELGAGSGLISFLLCKKGAIVTASDVSDHAVKGLKLNRSVLNLDIHVAHSNLFDDLKEGFDIIILNPPFFQKDPEEIAQRAWYCGKNFEFFEQLFQQFSQRDLGEGIWMILSEKAEIEQILSHATKHSLSVRKKEELISHGEKHFVYEVVGNIERKPD